MGRTLKRVPLNFGWPLNVIWGGYINPFYSQSTKCVSCDGTGSSPEYKLLQDRWYGYVDFRPEDRGSKPFTTETEEVMGFARRNCSHKPEFYGTLDTDIEQEARRLCKHFNSQWSHHLNQDDVDALLAADRLWDFTRTPRTEEQAQLVKDRLATGKHNSWLPESNGYRPTAEEVNLWSLGSMGHDSCNCWIVCRAECERLGHETGCSHCHGNGTLWPSEDIEVAAEAWQSTEPPVGEGFQLWETTSEGSPQSPIFHNIESLCEWCSSNATTFGNYRTTAEEWRKMLDEDFVCHRAGNIVLM